MLGTLAEIGYDAEWQDIRASDMGAPHKRERIWIIAYPQKDSSCADTNRIRSHREEKHKQKNVELRDQQVGIIGQMGKTLAHPSIERERGLSIRQRGSQQTSSNVERISKEFPNTIGKYDDNAGHGASEICRERSEKTDIQRSYPGKWLPEPAVCELADGVSNELGRYEGRLAVKPYRGRERLMGYGNAILAQIAELLFRQIKDLI